MPLVFDYRISTAFVDSFIVFVCSIVDTGPPYHSIVRDYLHNHPKSETSDSGSVFSPFTLHLLPPFAFYLLPFAFHLPLLFSYINVTFR